MTLRAAEGAAGPPWERPMRGRLERLVVHSELLESNPLGDPASRPLYVYVPPAATDACQSVYVIQGLTGQVDMWGNRQAFEPTLFERVDALFSDPSVPRAVVVFVDAWTSYGGSQFINSTGTGRYMDYLCDEVVPFVDRRYPVIADREHRGLTGKSSGGYGAMVVPMLRPDVFGGLASHAGDALFEACYLPEFPRAARIIRDKFDGSYDVFWSRLKAADRFDFETFGSPLNVYAMAACYSPDEARPGKAVLPFELGTGVLVDDVWQRWLSWDPVRMVPEHRFALASMKLVYLDAGRSDEYYLDLGAQAVSKRLADARVDHILELFDGKHGGVAHRYPKAIRLLAEALTR